jgi:hypothetical protein
VSTVGRDEVIREYIKNQEKEDMPGANEPVTLIRHLQGAPQTRARVSDPELPL